MSIEVRKPEKVHERGEEIRHGLLHENLCQELKRSFKLVVREATEARTSTGQIVLGAIFCFFKNVGVKLPMGSQSF